MGEKAHNRIYPASAHAWNAHVEVAKKAKKAQKLLSHADAIAQKAQ